MSPGSQISFRGVAAVGRVDVVGSVTGSHPGRLVQHSDHAGVSFVPAVPFAAGETLTVRTPLAVAGSSGGSFTYQVARPATASANAPSIYPSGGAAPARRTASSGAPSPGPTAAAVAAGGPYRSRPDLKPPPVTVTVGGAHAPGLLFTSSDLQTPSADTGLMIYDDGGEPVWFQSLPPTGLGTLQRIRYLGQDALVWFSGTQTFRGGFKGTWVVADTSYRQIAEIAAGNGLTADAHDLRISSDGTKALLDIYNPVHQDMSAYGGGPDASVYEAVVQEIDLGTGLVTFEWHSLDESPVTDSLEPLSGQDVDYFHLNSLEYDADGGILLSGRHVSQVLKLDRNAPTGARVSWRLGGKRSTYTFPNAADALSYPHDVRRRPDGTLSIYDNAVATTQDGRGIAYLLDDTARTAVAVRTWNHVPAEYGALVGSNRMLSNGDELVSYGNTGVATEYGAAGSKVWESRFGDGAWTYRTLRVDGWHAVPAEAPALVTDRSGNDVTGYVSWNGATEVAGWVLLAGPAADQLRPVGAVAPRTGFETRLTGTVTGSDTVVVAEARDSAGGTLRRTSTTATATPIQAHYNSLGGPGGLLGSPTAAERALPDGSYAGYQTGVIYYSPATEAWEVHGAILGEWAALGAQAGVLGYPTTDERGLPDGIGRYNLFAGGSIYWTPATGAHESHGAIRTKWTGLGSQAGLAGYPLTDETGTPDGFGRYNHFQRASIYWSPSTGAWEVLGAIRDKWASMGWETGVLGYPVTGETTTADGGGRYSRFAGGSVRWSPSTGAHEVHGAIGAHFAALGEEVGLLGYPVTDELGTPDGVGRFNVFTGGSLYWSPGSGAFEVHGAIRDAWAGQGWERGFLGYPLSDEHDAPGGRQSEFQHGSIFWDAYTGETTVSSY
ncbi:MAG: aryl-sulfate sulfotransferase [Actinomycetota bacterium]|nr:aryl-sulfate sulfotransferase [Actinomycetota bacterium]